MPRLTSRIVLLAVAGVMSVAPAFAAPPASSSASNASSQNNGNNGIDCSLPQNANDPFCLQLKSHTKGSIQNSSSSQNNGNGPNNGPNKGPMNGPPPGYKGPPSGTFNFSTQDRGYFDQRFHGMNFGDFSFFGSPSFSITIGTPLPNLYHNHLRPVPYSVYRYYPWFRGYVYFVDRRGEFVIVDPHRFRIVAVL